MLPFVWTSESYEHALPSDLIIEQLWKIQLYRGTVIIVVTFKLSVKVFVATLF